MTAFARSVNARRQPARSATLAERPATPARPPTEASPTTTLRPRGAVTRRELLPGARWSAQPPVHPGDGFTRRLSRCRPRRSVRDGGAQRAYQNVTDLRAPGTRAR